MSNKIIELLEPNAVELQIEATDAKDIVTILGNHLFEGGYVHDTFIDAALKRESELPTGLPLGGDFNAAIPHTDVEHVIKPGLALATLIEPVFFQNMISPEESVAVHLVILMALDQPKSQVEMLQEIAGMLQNPVIIRNLMEARVWGDLIHALSVS